MNSIKFRPIRVTANKFLQNQPPEILGGLKKTIKKRKLTQTEIAKILEREKKKLINQIKPTFQERKKQRHRYSRYQRNNGQPRQPRQPRSTQQSRLKEAFLKIPSRIIHEHLFPQLDELSINKILKQALHEKEANKVEEANETVEKKQPAKKQNIKPHPNYVQMTRELAQQFAEQTKQQVKKNPGESENINPGESENINQKQSEDIEAPMIFTVEQGKARKNAEKARKNAEKAVKIIKERFQELSQQKDLTEKDYDELEDLQLKNDIYDQVIKTGKKFKEIMEEMKALNQKYGNVQKQKVTKPRKKESGGGLGIDSKHGLSNIEIDNIMQNEPGYIGCFCIDEIDDVVDQVKKHNMQIFNFIVNTLTTEDFEEDEDVVGHWIGVYCDREEGDFCIFDCTATNPPDIIKEITGAFEKLFKKDTHMHKLKINKVNEQAANSYMCGWFCIRAIKMLNAGLPWKIVTGFKKVQENEEDMKKMKKMYEEYGYI